MNTEPMARKAGPSPGALRRVAGGLLTFGNEQEEQNCDRNPDDAHRQPELVPAHAGRDEWAHQELSG